MIRLKVRCVFVCVCVCVCDVCVGEDCVCITYIYIYIYKMGVSFGFPMCIPRLPIHRTHIKHSQQLMPFLTSEYETNVLSGRPTHQITPSRLKRLSPDNTTASIIAHHDIHIYCCWWSSRGLLASGQSDYWWCAPVVRRQRGKPRSSVIRPP